MDFRRKANPWAREIKGTPSQPERSGGLILEMAHRKVAGRRSRRGREVQLGKLDLLNARLWGGWLGNLMRRIFERGPCGRLAAEVEGR